MLHIFNPCIFSLCRYVTLFLLLVDKNGELYFRSIHFRTNVWFLGTYHEVVSGGIFTVFMFSLSWNSVKAKMLYKIYHKNKSFSLWNPFFVNWGLVAQHQPMTALVTFYGCNFLKVKGTWVSGNTTLKEIQTHFCWYGPNISFPFPSKERVFPRFGESGIQ